MRPGERGHRSTKLVFRSRRSAFPPLERMGWWPARQKTIDRDRKGSPPVRTPADSLLKTNSLVLAVTVFLTAEQPPNKSPRFCRGTIGALNSYT